MVSLEMIYKAFIKSILADNQTPQTTSCGTRIENKILQKILNALWLSICITKYHEEICLELTLRAEMEMPLAEGAERDKAWAEALKNQEVVPTEVLLKMVDRELEIIDARQHQLLHVKRLHEKHILILNDKISYVSATYDNSGQQL